MVEWLQYNSGEKYLSSNPSKDLMDLLVEKTWLVGHMLTFEEASRNPELFRVYHYSKHYASFEHAAALAWGKVQQFISMNSEISKFKPVPFIIEEIPSKSKNARKRKVRKNSIQQKPRGRHIEKEIDKMHKMGKRYNEEEALGLIVDYYRRTGKIPSYSTANSCNNLPSYPTILKILGPRKNWESIIINQSKQ